MRPRAAVLIPTLDEAAWIGRTIAAIRRDNPTGQDDKLLVVDCGSTDGTVDIARAAGASVVSVDVRSAYVARNKGVDTTDEEWIAFLDADCIPDPGWLSSLIS